MQKTPKIVDAFDKSGGTREAHDANRHKIADALDQGLSYKVEVMLCCRPLHGDSRGKKSVRKPLARQGRAGGEEDFPRGHPHKTLDIR